MACAAPAMGLYSPIDDLVRRLGSEDLPVLANTAAEIAKQAIRGERASAQDISDIVLHDPFFTLNVLHAIGMRKRSRLSSEITTIEHAVMMFGAQPFFARFANPKIVEDQFKNNPQGLLQLRRALSRAHHAACQACDWAIYRNDMESEEVYIAAAINDLAEQYLCLVAPDLAAKLTEEMRRDPNGTSSAQQALLGFDLRSLFDAMLRAVKLPDLMKHLTDPSKAQAARVNNVQLAAAVARHAEFGWDGPALEQDMAAAAALLRIPQEDAISRIHRTAVLAARAWHWYRAPPAARWLPLLPEPAAPELKPKSAAQSSGSMQELMRWAMQALQTEAGLSRVVFALRTSDGQALRAKICLGEAESSPFAQFEIGLANQHLLTRLLQKQQGVWFNQQNENNLQPYLSAELQRVIGRGEFFAHSVFLGPKPFGLFYGDSRGDQLNEARYQKFKEIVARVTRAMHRLAGKTP
jgi:hypothetical protein